MSLDSLKYPKSPFVLPTKRPVVVLPFQIFDEVRNLPESQVSFAKLIAADFAAEYTGIKNRPEMIIAIKVDLTRHIADALDDLQDEVQFALDKELDPGELWNSVVLYSTVARVVAMLSGRIFVGRPLSRNEDWIDASINFTSEVMEVQYALNKWSPGLRRLVAPFLPQVRRVKEHMLRCGQLLDPVLKETIVRSDLEKSKSLQETSEQGSFISWILKHTPLAIRNDSFHLAEIQMSVSFAAIHTTTMAVTHAILDLVSRPTYIEILRAEIDRVIATNGQDADGNGHVMLKKMSIPKLKKLDSFIKESQRLSPPSYLTNGRLTTAPLRLSTGHTLPPNTVFAFSAHNVHIDPNTTAFSSSYNPPINKPPTEFDGLRFYNLRDMEGRENKHQFVTTSMDSLVFGHGIHACPGRFFASNEIKVILIELLRNWDMRLVGDLEMKGGEDKRPKNVTIETSILPDSTAKIEIRRRKA